MPNDGKVTRKIVLETLGRCGVVVDEKSKDFYLLQMGDAMEVINLPFEVCRRRLQELQRKFRVPIHYFYNPDMAPKRELGLVKKRAAK